jgi:hypothetical protein
MQLLRENGGSLALLSILAKETTYNRNRLARELLKIADQVPVSSPPQKFATSVSPKKPAPRQRANPTIKSEDWPPPLKPAVERLQNLYQLVNHYHPQMDQLYNINRKQAFDVKCKVQDSWQEISEIWRILNYWTDNKVVLPNKYNPDEKHLPYDRARLMKQRNNLRTYISRSAKDPAKADKVKEWRLELLLIEKKLGHAI